jgi:hypothetical protein
MRNTNAILCITLSVLASLSVQANTEQSLDVNRFNRVAASQGVEVNITMGSSTQVVVKAETEKDLERLEIEVDDGELRIRRGAWSSSIWNWRSSGGRVSVGVVVSELEGLSSSWGAKVTATDVDCEELSLDASSGSKIVVSGGCNAVKVDVSSGAVVDARDFKVEVVTVDASSGANIDVFASVNFQGDASSGASVDVFGTPELFEANTSSGARIARRGWRELI